MNEINTTSIEILALFSSFKEKRIKLYESFIRDINDFQDWSVSAEKLLAYYITVRNLKKNSKIIVDQIQQEIIRLSEGDFTLQ